jgi:hypothetical protein
MTARVQVPETVRDAIRARLARLDAQTRAVLERAAILGRDVDARILASMLEADDPATLTSAIRSALAAGVLVEIERDVYGFSHALVREALYRDLATGERRRLHARAAKCLDRAGAPEAARAEILSHLLAAGDEVAVDEVAGGAMRAAARAMRAYAFEDAAAILDQTIPVLDERGAAPHDVAEALVLLGEARARLRQDASGPCRRAAEIARTIDDPDLLARAALALGAVIVPAVVNATLVELLQTALRQLPDGKSVIRAKVLARMAGALQPAADPRQPMQIARAAIAMAREVGDRAALRAVLVGAGSALVDYALPGERLEVDRETLRLAEEDGDAPSAFRAHVRLFMDQLELGRVRAADQSLAEADRLSAVLRRPKYAWYACTMRAARALQQGRFDVADDLERRARDIVTKAGEKELTGLGGLYACASAILRGEDARLRECFEAFFDYGFGTDDDYGLEQVTATFARTRTGDLDGLEASFARLPAHQGMATIDPIGMYMLSEIRFVGRIVEGADVLLANMNARRGLFLTWGGAGFVPFGPISWLLARLESLLGSWSDAERDFEDAIASCKQMGAKPALLQVLLDYGVAVGRCGDGRERSEALFSRAAELAAELALPALVLRVESARSLFAEAEPSAPRRTVARSSELPAAPAFSFQRDGEGWVVSRADRSFRVKDTRGMGMLAELVAEPGCSKHALLLGGTDPGDLGDAGATLDAQAIRAYRDRLEDLREREREAEEAADGARAARARAEINAIAEQLAQGLGLGGRHRRAASAVERARSNVQRRLKDAIRRIEDQDPELGQYLSWTVRTGTFCVFDPKISTAKKPDLSTPRAVPETLGNSFQRSSRPLGMGDDGQNQALLVAVTEAVDGARPRRHDFALVVGSVDRRLARPLGGARVVMYEGATGLSLPRDSLATALCVLGPSVPSVGVDSLVAMRNALARDAPLLVVGSPDRVAEIAEVASAAGFSRKASRLLSSGYCALELKR